MPCEMLHNPEKMKWTYNDGGRSKYFRAKKVKDCVTRAIAIATDRDYKEVYDTIRKIVGYSPRGGVFDKDTQTVMKHFGGKWVANKGRKIHLRDSEMPRNGRFALRLANHVTCIVDGVIQDIYDPSRDGQRIVFGFWIF